MDEIKLELALEIIQKKIVDYIKNYKGSKEEFVDTLKKLADEREEVYNLNEEIINKLLNEK